MKDDDCVSVEEAAHLPPLNKNLGQIDWARWLRPLFRRALRNVETGDVKLPVLEDSIEGVRLRFLGVMISTPGIGKPLARDTLPVYCKWYLDFLETRFQTILRSHLAPALGLTDGGDISHSEHIKIYRFMTTTAGMLAECKDLALQDIVTQLKEKEILTSVSASEHTLHQLVFMVVGWLTMLYEPDLRPEPEKLQINKYERTSQSVHLRTQVFHQFEENLDHNDLVKQPLNDLFRVFGHLVPQSETFLSASERGYAANPYNQENLILSYLCYNTLQRVGQIRIEWVDSLSMHLEFDEAHKIVKIFRFPSFCRIIYAGERKRTFLSRLFEDSRASEISENNNPSTLDFQDGAFFRELLLSYRLLFGQDRRSWKAFLSKQARPPKYGSPSSQDVETDIDPLIRALCGSDCKNQALYREIQAGDPSRHYSPISDFPFLGKRLLVLQHYCRGQNPYDWKDLWSDRRDLLRFYTFWAVIFVGGGALVVGLLQLVLSALQLAAAYKQIKQQVGAGVGSGGGNAAG